MAKKAAPKAAEVKAAAASEKKPKAATKAEVYGLIAEKTKLSKKDVAAVFGALNEMMVRELGKKGPGVFQVPGMLKLKAVFKPATKAKQAPNPFKPGEMMTIKAKPARKVIKASALKALKDNV